VQMTWWEHDELLEHLRSRPDLWTEDNDLWVRFARRPVDEEQIAVFAMQLLPPVGTGRFRMYTLHSTPVVWEDTTVTEYLEWVLRNFTTYGARIETVRILTEELGVPLDKANMGAVVLSHTHCVGSIYEQPQYFEPDAMQRPDPLLPVPVQQRVLGQWELVRGGWLRLCENGSQLLSILLDINGHQSEHRANAFPGPSVVAFRGMVRPIGTDMSLLHTHLYGFPEGDL
jgi:hypothetical protein